MGLLPGGEFELPKVSLIEDEYELLADLVCSSPRWTPGIALLWQELERAQVVSPDQAPADLVHLHSIVHFTDLSMGKPAAGQLVRRFRRDLGSAIPVASPMGAALIGLRPGDRFAWRSREGLRRAIRVDSVASDARARQRRAAAGLEGRRRLARELLSLD